MANTLRSALYLVLSFLMILSQPLSAATNGAPNAGVVISDGNGTVILPQDIFPPDPAVKPGTGGIIGNPNGIIGFPDPILNPGGFPIIGAAIGQAIVPEQFACPLFQGENTKELIAAIDALTMAMNAIQTTPECKGAGTQPGEVESTAAGLKDALKSITGMMTPDPNAAAGTLGGSTANVAEIEKQMNTVVGSIKKLGDTLKGNSLLNPMCGRKVNVMKVFTSFNDIILGTAPLFLFAVSVNPALAPLLKWVVGTVAVSGGFSVLGQILENTDSIDMDKSENRNAYVKNLCQYLKVLRKYQLMQEARSGKVDQILKQLDANVVLYKNSLEAKRMSVSKMLNFLDVEKGLFNLVEKENKSDLQSLAQVEEGINRMKSPAFLCSMANNLVSEANHGRFPKSVFTNYRRTVEIVKINNQEDPAYKRSLLMIRSLEQTDSINRNQLTAAQGGKAADIETCAKVAKEWFALIREVANQTKQMIETRYSTLDAKFMSNFEFKSYRFQKESVAKGEALTQQVKQVVKLAENEWQAVEDSSTAMQMRKLKQTFFGSGPIGPGGKLCQFFCGSSPTHLWLNSTFQEYLNAKARFDVYMGALRVDAFHQQVVDAKAKPFVPPSRNAPPINYAEVIRQQQLERENLQNIDLKRFPKGSVYHQNICKNLKGAWLNMDEARVHLAATQYLCKMISPVLDRVDVESAIVDYCMDDIIPGKIKKYSKINTELINLKAQKVNDMARLVKSKMDLLECPIQTN